MGYGVFNFKKLKAWIFSDGWLIEDLHLNNVIVDWSSELMDRKFFTF